MRQSNTLDVVDTDVVDSDVVDTLMLLLMRVPTLLMLMLMLELRKLMLMLHPTKHTDKQKADTTNNQLNLLQFCSLILHSTT